MSSLPDFEGLIRRVRAGDERAAEELVRRYEFEVRDAVRSGLQSKRLRGQFDSVDVAQSVLARFFVGAAAGEFDLAKPEDLVKLLVTMAKNRLIDVARKQKALRRDRGRERPLDAGESVRIDPPAPEPSPSRMVAGRELFEEFRKRLSEEERYLADQRALGRPWNELAAELGERADALRMRLARAVERISKEMEI
ncbi:MAG: sigma-70 family RNA polymerase sigma factor [Planctomycetes bacterium]|nr:sigma-70 family RNA polymerase sigma factor [Planctomycetota bacterium]